MFPAAPVMATRLAFFMAGGFYGIELATRILTMPSRAARFAASMVVALIGSAAAAQLGPRERPVQRNHIDAWLNRARLVEDQLKEGAHGKAEHDASALLEEMLR